MGGRGRGHILFILPNSGNEQSNCQLPIATWQLNGSTTCVSCTEPHPRPWPRPSHLPLPHSKVYLTRPHTTYIVFADTAVWLWFMHNECTNCFVFVFAALDWKFFLAKLLSAKRLRKINAIWIGCERALKLILHLYYLSLEILSNSNELLMQFAWPSLNFAFMQINFQVFD